MCLSPNLVQRPVQYKHFRATHYDHRLSFVHAEDAIDLTAVMQSHDENEKLALDQFMVHFFTSFLNHVQNYRDATVSSNYW